MTSSATARFLLRLDTLILTAFKLPVSASYSRTWAKWEGNPFLWLFGYTETSLAAKVSSNFEYAGINPNHLKVNKQIHFKYLELPKLKSSNKITADCDDNYVLPEF